jgi:hypothetical protein
MGICFGKQAAPISGTQSYTPSSEAAPARQPQPSPSARNSEEGVLSGLPRRGQEAGAFHHTVAADAYRDVVDFSAMKVERQTIRERGESLRTSALVVCTGVAVGGVRRDSDGSVAASSVSIFHVLPGVPSPGVAIARKVEVLRAAGFEVNAVIAGGDGTTRAGRNQREALEGMLHGMGVPLQAGDLSNGFRSQFISATIEDDGEIGYETYSGY